MSIHGEYEGQLLVHPWRAEYASIPKDVIAKLRKPSEVRWFLALAMDWAAIVLSMIVARKIDHWAVYGICTIFLGTRLHALTVLAHEGAHQIVSKKQWANIWLANLLCFWPVFVDVNTYADFHIKHHRYLNTADDPEMKWRSLGAPTWDVPRSRVKVAIRFFLDLMGLGIKEVVHVLWFTAPRTPRRILGPVCIIGTATTICALTGNLWILAMWFGGVITGFSAVWRFRCLIDGHLAAEDCHRVQLTWWQAYLVAPHNIWLHWEHHHFPAIPYYNLTKLRKLIMSVPIMSLHELFKHYECCKPVKTGEPIRDKSGALLVQL